MKKRIFIFPLALMALVLASCTNTSPSLVEPSELLPSTTSSLAPSSEATPSTHNHNLSFHEAKDANCTDDGNSAYYTCTECNAVFDENKNSLDAIPVIAKLNHEYVDHIGVINGLSTTGAVTFYTCDRCELYFNSSYEVIDELNSDTDRINYLIGSTSSVLLIGYDYELADVSALSDKLNALIDDITKDIDDGIKEIDPIVDEIREMGQLIDDLADQYVLYRLTFSIFNVEEYSDKVSEIYSMYYQAYDFIYVNVPLLMYDSAYKSRYYEDMTEEEIQEYLNGKDPEKSARINELSDIIVAARYSENSTNEQMVSSIKTIADAGNELAKLTNYNNYLEYSNREFYYRGYEIKKGLEIRRYIKDYIVPLVNKIEAASSAIKLSDEEVAEYNKMYNYMSYKFDEVKAYATFMGGKYKDSFDNLLKDGHYFLSSIENNTTTAFSDFCPTLSQFLFFGSRYQQLSTFIHEFGHHNAGRGVSDFDLAEVNSIGNELLFAQYLLNKYPDNNIIKKYYLNIITDQLYMAIAALGVYSVEDYVFNTIPSNITLEGMQQVWDDYVTDIGAAWLVGNTYYLSPAVFDSGYYLSYTVAGLTAVSIVAVATTDFDKAKEIYTKSYTFPENKALYVLEFCEYADIPSVFDEDLYKNLAAAFSKY